MSNMDKCKELTEKIKKEESVDYNNLPIYEAVGLEVILDDSGKEVLIENMEQYSLLWKYEGKGAIPGWHYFPEGKENPKSTRVIFERCEKIF